MAAYDNQLQILGDTIRITGPGGIDVTLPKSYLDAELKRVSPLKSYQQQLDHAQAQLDAHDIATNRPEENLIDKTLYPYATRDYHYNPLTPEALQKAQATVAEYQQKIDSYDPDWWLSDNPSRSRHGIASNILRTAGLGDYMNQARDSQVKQDYAEKSASSFGGSILKPAVKGAIGLGVGALGTAALAPALGLGSLGSAGLFSTDAAIKGALQGGISGLVSSGGDLGNALKAAGIGGATGGFGDSLASAAGIRPGAGTSAFKGALAGAAGGLASGDLRDAGIGAVTGGALGYASGGGKIPGLGQKAGASLDQATGISGMQGPTQGSGLYGSLTKSNTLGVGTGGGSSSLGGSMNLGTGLKLGGTLYSGYNNQRANEEIKEQLLAASGRARDTLSPYSQAGLGATNQLSQALRAGFNPGDLANDPGYQFQLAQGQKAIDRGLAAQGMSQSGAAIKAATEFGQGLADQTYKDAYQRWLAQNEQLAGLGNMGYGAATNLAGIEQDMGGIRGLTTAANNQNFNRTLASLLDEDLLASILQGVF